MGKKQRKEEVDFIEKLSIDFALYVAPLTKKGKINLFNKLKSKIEEVIRKSID